MCPECGDGNFDGYCWDCGYDTELGPNLIDQLDSELECQKIAMGVYDQVNDGYTDSEFPEDDDGESFFNEFAR